MAQPISKNATETPPISTRFKRIFSKPKVNKCLLRNVKRVPTEYIGSLKDKNDHLQQEIMFDSQPDIMQIHKLQVSLVNEPKSFLENNKELDTIVKTSVNCNGTKMIKEDVLGDSSCLNPDLVHNILPPSSLKEICRSSIKADVHLAQHTINSSIHGSASDAKDNITMKHKQIRIDSASSSTATEEVNNDRVTELSPKLRNIKPYNQRRFFSSKQCCKIAGAQHNFTLKFGKSSPDKQKLMMDLIPYNPYTEPLSQKSVTKHGENLINEELTEDSVEKKSTITIVNEEEDENGFPAPQIKIGANGEIIIDEQSLVIENSQTRKSREKIKKLDIIDADLETGYGVFKRVKRAKGWSELETVHFYKALNTLGTDFTMMSEFFHNRTRRDLKVKFKKEERMNLSLIDKALSQPPHFDIVELQQDFEKYKKLLDDLATDELLKKSNKCLKKSQKETNAVVLPPRKKKKKDLYSRLEKGAASLWESTSEDELVFENSVPSVPIKNKARSRRSRKNKLAKLGDDVNSGNK